MQKNTLLAIANGVLAGSLFLLVFAVGLGFIFLFLPSLPLFHLGLSVNRRKLPMAIGVSLLPVALAGSLGLAVVYALFLAFPVWYMCRYSLVAAPAPEGLSWYPIGDIMLRLTLYGCSFVAFITLYHMFQGDSLPQMLAESIRHTFADLEPDYGEIIDLLAGNLSFLMFPVTLWLWGLLLYAHGWAANKLLVRQGRALRPDFRVVPFAMPGWMLTLLGICGLASLIGSESLSFLGKITVLSLMMPYFFLGAAILHRASAQMPSRTLLLFFVYFMIFSQFWPALILSAVGLYHQVKSFRVQQPQK